MRVVQVLLGLNTGGMELLALDLAIACRAAGLDSHILALDGDELTDRRFIESEIPLTRLSGRRLMSPTYFREVHAALAGLRPCIVHTHHFAPLIHSVVPAARLGIQRHVHTEHGANYLERRPALRWLLRAMSARVHRIVLVGERMRPFYVDRVRVRADRLVVIENGVDTSKFAPRESRAEVRSRLGLPDGPLVVTSARLHPQKNIPMLVAAAARVVERLPAAQFVVIGDGEERATIEHAVRREHLEGRFHLLGWSRNVAEVLSAGDVFALSSIWEGLPLAVLEAMACGLPVVATRVGDLDRVVREGETGHLVPVGDALALADRILSLLTAPERAVAFGAAARRAVSEKYSLDAMVRAYLDVYRAN